MVVPVTEHGCILDLNKLLPWPGFDSRTCQIILPCWEKPSKCQNSENWV